MLPTTPARASHDYQRNGTIDLFAALDIATGTVITDLRKTHTPADFIAFLNKNKTADEILERLAGYCTAVTTNDSSHGTS
jgi:hypothetical protein